MVGLDVDGVIANWYLSMCKHYDKPYEMLKRWGEPWLTEYYKDIVNNVNFWDNLEILNSPHEVKKVDYYVTAIEPSLLDSRVNWLKKNGFPDAPVIVAYEKGPVVKKLGIKYFLDDKQQNCEEIRAEGIICYRYVPYYMIVEETPWDVRSLAEFYNKIEKHEKGEKPEIQSIQGKMGFSSL